MSVEQKRNSTIRVNNLTLAYEEYSVLENVSFDVEKGKCLFVMGGSGCGKVLYSNQWLVFLNLLQEMCS